MSGTQEAGVTNSLRCSHCGSNQFGFQHFQTGSMFIFLCLRSITMKKNFQQKGDLNHNIAISAQATRHQKSCRKKNEFVVSPVWCDFCKVLSTVQAKNCRIATVSSKKQKPKEQGHNSLHCRICAALQQH